MRAFADLTRRAAGKPVRVASKSLRVPALIRRALDTPGFAETFGETRAYAGQGANISITGSVGASTFTSNSGFLYSSTRNWPEKRCARSASPSACCRPASR